MLLFMSYLYFFLSKMPILNFWPFPISLKLVCLLISGLQDFKIRIKKLFLGTLQILLTFFIQRFNLCSYILLFYLTFFWTFSPCKILYILKILYRQYFQYCHYIFQILYTFSSLFHDYLKRILWAFFDSSTFQIFNIKLLFIGNRFLHKIWSNDLFIF